MAPETLSPSLQEIGEDKAEIKESPAEIKNEAIAELEEPIKYLLSQMREKINSDAYGLLIGDDTSGRIPTLAFREVLSQIASRKDQTGPETIFFAGAKDISYKKLDNKMQDMATVIKKYEALREKNQSILVITDTIETGKSLTPLLDTLKELELPFDVATITLFNSELTQRGLEEKYNCRVFNGSMGHARIYGKTHLSGVVKKPEDLHAQPLKKHPSMNKLLKKLDAEQMQNMIIEARQDTHVLAQKLIKWFRRENPKS